MLVSLIAAMAKNRVIGRSGKVPWRLEEDMAYFKKTTLGHPLIVGRKTWETLGGPLSGREMVVLSRQDGYRAPGCRVANSIEAALGPYNSGPDEVFVAGGEQVYRLALPLAGRICLTIVEGRYEGDAFFPSFGDDEFLPASTTKAASGRCSFLVYERVLRRLE